MAYADSAFVERPWALFWLGGHCVGLGPECWGRNADDARERI